LHTKVITVSDGIFTARRAAYKRGTCYGHSIPRVVGKSVCLSYL